MCISIRKDRFAHRSTLSLPRLGDCEKHENAIEQVVLGTKNELLKAWRSLDDFSRLASETKGLRIARVDKHWDAVEDMLHRKNGQHSSTYRRTQASSLQFFLATLVEELDERNIEVRLQRSSAGSITPQ